MIVRLEEEIEAHRPRKRRGAAKQRKRATNGVRLSKDPTPLVELLRSAEKPMTAAEIGDKLGLSTTTVTRTAGNLVGDLLTVATERGNGPRERKIYSLREKATA